MAKALASLDQAIAFIAASDEKKDDEVPIDYVKAYKQQKFVKLVTKVDAKNVNESEIPIFGLGTWRSAPGKVSAAVEYALKIGYRHIDCAAIYGNEPEIGTGLAACFKAGIKREHIFITSKLWNTRHATKDVVPALKQTLSDLGLKQLDLYLIHWPLTLRAGDDNFPKTEKGDMDYGDIVPHTETWKGMEQCVRLGLTKHIGLSNFNEAQIDAILKDCKIRPTVLQCEGHAYLSQDVLRKYCHREKMILEAYSPLGNPSRPPGWDHSLAPVMQNEVVVEIAKECAVTPADVCIRYQIQRGVVVIPKSTTPSRIKSNFEVWDFKLSDDQMLKLSALNQNLRYGIPTVVDEKTKKRVIRDGVHPFWPWKDTMYG